MTQNEKHKLMYEDYCNGMSLSEVGNKYNITRQSVYTGFKRRNFKMRQKIKLPYVYFNKNKYTLRNHGYYACTTGKRTLMHRDIWEHYNDKIPEFYDIHHINRNKLNNRIDNLELLRKDEHARRFNTGRNQYSKK